MGENASVLVPERKVAGVKAGGQLTQAERMLAEARTELERVMALLGERAKEKHALEEQLRTITSSADVDRIMVAQQKIKRQQELTRELERKRTELQQSVDNKTRYVETLRVSLETMKNEIQYLEERLQPQGHHEKRIQALETDLELARSGKSSEANRLAQLRRQIWMIIGA
jgi:chromosome segregation ATPase